MFSYAKVLRPSWLMLALALLFAGAFGASSAAASTVAPGTVSAFDVDSQVAAAKATYIDTVTKAQSKAQSQLAAAHAQARSVIYPAQASADAARADYEAALATGAENLDQLLTAFQKAQSHLEAVTKKANRAEAKAAHRIGSALTKAKAKALRTYRSSVRAAYASIGQKPPASVLAAPHMPSSSTPSTPQDPSPSASCPQGSVAVGEYCRVTKDATVTPGTCSWGACQAYNTCAHSSCGVTAVCTDYSTCPAGYHYVGKQMCQNNMFVTDYVSATCTTMVMQPKTCQVEACGCAVPGASTCQPDSYSCEPGWTLEGSSCYQDSPRP